MELGSDYTEILKTLQAGILKPDGRKHRRYIFVRFRPEEEIDKEILERLIEAAVVKIKMEYEAEGYESDEIPADDELYSYAEALYMGRFKNGTPLALSNKALPRSKWRIENQDLPFGYKNDATGLICPMGAHVRSMNPFGSGQNSVAIIRRGMLFSEDSFKGKSPRRGLLFVSYQKSLVNGFEILFDRMALPNNVDPIAYRPDSVKGEDGYFKASPIPEVVFQADFPAGGNKLTAFRGGEYFFMPSLSFIKSLL